MQQAIFDRGHDVGRLAQKLFPDGIDVSPKSYKDYSESLSITEKSINNKTSVIYEAAFQFNEVLAASDIVVRDGDKWKIYEVKSSTNVTDTNVLDAAIQYYIISNLGIEISDFSVVTINNKYVREGNLNLDELFNITSVLKSVKKKEKSIADEVKKLKEIISKNEIPKVEIGEHCTNPYTCSFYGYCWKHIPKDSIFEISGMHLKKKFELYRNGTTSIFDIPDDLKLGNDQRLQVDCYKNDNTIIDKNSIENFLITLPYPLFFLDFESFQPAVPLYDNSRPYQQVTFQYSLHYKAHSAAELLHYEFLADTGEDPRIGFISNLINDLKKPGDIVVYNKTYEIGRLQELARDFPQYADELESIVLRIKDLMVPFRKKYYYDPKMKGSYSIKYVLPALVPELDYENMDIANGIDASLGFENLQNETDMFRVQEIRNQLLEYCKLDTLAMVRILTKLEEVVKDI
ncbi:DUF2779 domain-containing protein [Bacteroidota bacterium]